MSFVCLTQFVHPSCSPLYLAFSNPLNTFEWRSANCFKLFCPFVAHLKKYNLCFGHELFAACLTSHLLSSVLAELFAHPFVHQRLWKQRVHDKILWNVNNSKSYFLCKKIATITWKHAPSDSYFVFTKRWILNSKERKKLKTCGGINYWESGAAGAY